LKAGARTTWAQELPPLGRNRDRGWRKQCTIWGRLRGGAAHVCYRKQEEHHATRPKSRVGTCTRSGFRSLNFSGRRCVSGHGPDRARLGCCAGWRRIPRNASATSHHSCPIPSLPWATRKLTRHASQGRPPVDLLKSTQAHFRPRALNDLQAKPNGKGNTTPSLPQDLVIRGFGLCTGQLTRIPLSHFRTRELGTMKNPPMLD